MDYRRHQIEQHTYTVNCLVEYDTAYAGNSIGAEVDQPDWQSCESFCTATHPSASLFQHLGNKCECKSSNKGGRRTESGATSGGLRPNCVGGATPTDSADIALAMDGDVATSYRDARPVLHKWAQFELDATRAQLPLTEVIISLNIPQ